MNEFEIPAEPNSTLSQVAAAGTGNLINVFLGVCNNVKVKTFDAGQGLEQVADELNKGDFLDNFLKQVNLRKDLAKFNQHLNGAGDPKYSEENLTTEKETETPNNTGLDDQDRG